MEAVGTLVTFCRFCRRRPAIHRGISVVRWLPNCLWCFNSLLYASDETQTRFIAEARRQMVWMGDLAPASA